MPLAAIIVGAMLLDLAFRGTEHAFAKQIGSDFGGGEFWSWAGAMGALGIAGYVPALRNVSTAAMGLVVVVLILKNGQGAFPQLASVLTHPPAPAPAIPLSQYGSSGSGSKGGGGGGLLSGLFGGGSSGGGSGLAGDLLGAFGAFA